MAIRALWATPRTVSTAFERMMIERGDHLVLDEPWSRVYYLGPDRSSPRYPLVFPEATATAVEAGVLAAGSGRTVFVKDMAYHAVDCISDAALAAMHHTFLIRDPRAALVSLHRRWPDFTDAEAGHGAQLRLFDRIVDAGCATPLVIDSDALRADPDHIVGSWCDAVGLARRVDALTWGSGMRPEWPLWHEWFAATAASTGFEPPRAAEQVDVPERVARLLPDAQAAYERLRVHAIG